MVLSHWGFSPCYVFAMFLTLYGGTAQHFYCCVQKNRRKNMYSSCCIPYHSPVRSRFCSTHLPDTPLLQTQSEWIDMDLEVETLLNSSYHAVKAIVARNRCVWWFNIGQRATLEVDTHVLILVYRMNTRTHLHILCIFACVCIYIYAWVLQVM